mmetsp:Transcript_20497/g.47420  ORF Transcript_20497/g.47420 Transcript_20497/m.47420 type:complete len:98 (+) Transcript_20497:665-958(+)
MDAGGRACWDYFRESFPRVSAKFEDTHLWGTCVGLSCRGLRSHQEADEVESFFRNLPQRAGSAERRLSQTLEAIRTAAARATRDRGPVAQYLNSLNI